MPAKPCGDLRRRSRRIRAPGRTAKDEDEAVTQGFTMDREQSMPGKLELSGTDLQGSRLVN